MSDAVALARQVDTVVLVCGLNPGWESEGDDRPNLSLPMKSDELIHKVAGVNSNTIVVIQGGSAVSMPWLDKVKGVVQAWYGGCETGTSIADVVYGNVNPSGRLPLTFPRTEEDIPAAMCYKSANIKTYYEEGIWVGYTHYNARKIEPLFPFGHGLSYTTFAYSSLEITDVSPSKTSPDHWQLSAQVDVTNTGKVAGDHSVHFYVSPPPETATGLKHPKQPCKGSPKFTTCNLRPRAPQGSRWTNVRGSF
jgi:beta-glucosidase